MATIGLRDLFIAEITGEGENETYETPERLAKAISAELSVETADGVLHADDNIDEILKEFVKGTLKLNTNDLEPGKAALLLGQTITTDGITFSGEEDDPPYFAVGFRAKKPSGGKYRYLWIYKTKFKVPSETFETKGDGINFITPEIEGEFIKRDKDGMWKADYTGTPDDAIAKAWFDEVVEYEGA